MRWRLLHPVRFLPNFEMSNLYSEDQLVEQPAIGLFAKLGWPTVSALAETFGAIGTLGRETKSEVVLVEQECRLGQPQAAPKG